MATETSDAWIFQANPADWHIDRFLEDVTRGCASADVRWLVTRHRDAINVGDQVYLWRAGRTAGIVALATITGDIVLLPEDKHEYRAAPEKFAGVRDRVPIHIDEVLQRPITRTSLQFHDGLSGLSILRSAQGTNFAVTAAEAADLHHLLRRRAATPSHRTG